MPQLPLATISRLGRRRHRRPSTVASSWPGPVPQLAPNADGRRGRRLEQRHRGLGRDAHHGAAVGVEAQGHDDRQAGRRPRRPRRPRPPRPRTWSRSTARRRRPRPAPAPARRRRRRPRPWSWRPAARRARRSGPIEPATSTGRPAASATPRATAAAARVELADPVLRLVQLQPLAGAAEAVGQDDVGAGRRRSRDAPRRPARDAARSRAPGCRRWRGRARTGPCPCHRRPAAPAAPPAATARSAMLRPRSPWRAGAAGCPPRSSARWHAAARAAAAGSRGARACRHRASARFRLVVRRQPSHTRRSASSRHTPMQGDGMSPTKLTAAGFRAPRHQAAR